MKRSLLMLSVVLAAVGCDEKKPTADNAATASATAPVTASASATAPAQASASAMPPHGKMKRGGGGLAAMFLGAARDLTLKDDQKPKLEALDQQLGAESPRDEMKTLHAVVTDGVKAGKIDIAKVEAEQANVEKAMKARKDKEAEVLNGLHAALEPAQRTALVAAVRDRIKKREERADKWKDKGGPDGAMKGPDGKGPDGKPGMMKGPDGKPGMMKGPDGKMGGPGGAHHFGRLTKDLDLDAEQQKKIDAVLAKQKDDKADMKAEHEKMREDMKKRTDALLAAFEKDGFDAKKQEAFTFEDKAGKMMRGPMDPKVLAEIVPILKPEQREKLAAKMQMGGKGGHKKGGPGGPNAALGGDAGAADDDDDDDDDK